MGACYYSPMALPKFGRPAKDVVTAAPAPAETEDTEPELENETQAAPVSTLTVDEAW